ncbi:MAG: acylating sulfoacetaldehyde dehydrogenase [Thiolinea sp.]
MSASIPSDQQQAAIETVAGLMRRARAAQEIFAGYTQAQVDEVVLGVAWTLMEPANNRRLSEQAVSDTGIGDVDDKIIKNHRKTLGLLRDLKQAQTVGVIADKPEQGLVEIARPIGVVGAVVPSTNPVATPFNNVLNALKCANAIILAPSPKGQGVCNELILLIHAVLDKLGAPRDLVQMLPMPINKANSYELMRQVDLIVVTGSQNNVRACYSSGTPALGVGSGNVPSIIDDSADLADAAQKVMASKTFDNATSCSSENSLIVLDAVYDDMMAAMEQAGARMLDAAEKQQLQSVLWDEHGHLSRHVIAQKASRIVDVAGFQRDALQGDTVRCLMVEESGWGVDYPYSDEKLSPVLAVYRATDFDHACDIAEGILRFKGQGHSLSIHTQDDQHVSHLGEKLPVCRVIVNQAHTFATGGSFNNGMPFSLSMGCGSWGGNSIDDNLNYRHFMNTTKIVRTIEPNEPTLDEIFGEYWEKQGIAGA